MDEPVIVIGTDGKPQWVKSRALNREESEARMNALYAESLEAQRIAELRDKVVEASRMLADAQIAVSTVEHLGGGIASRAWNKAAGVHQEALREWKAAVNALMEAEKE